VDLLNGLKSTRMIGHEDPDSQVRVARSTLSRLQAVNVSSVANTRFSEESPRNVAPTCAQVYEPKPSNKVEENVYNSRTKCTG
jgi:hypothetical protein